MLQIDILHYEDAKTKILEIKDKNTGDTISEFNDEQDKIDLLPLINHVGETISVVHFNRFNGCTKLDREIEAVITQVDKFSDTDIWYLQYEPLL